MQRKNMMKSSYVYSTYILKNGLVNFNMRISLVSQYYGFNLVSSNLLQTTGELLQVMNIFQYVKHTVEKYLS